jgi:acetoin:2,6-dichlorophenolindophenol oxidoreductase subunit alpha
VADSISLYRSMLLIRVFEERVLFLFSKGKLFGTTHAYIGQEANAVGVISNLRNDDVVFASHRCHGHYLAKTGDVFGLLSELMGKATGICGGIGGSQHLFRQSFYSNGVQGSYLPIVCGMAFAKKRNQSDSIVTAFVGDGTLGEGSTYEAFNLASLFAVPLLIVIENNQYAQTTHISQNLAGSIVERPRAFGIESVELDTTDVEIIKREAGAIISKIRRDKKPRVLLLHTYRFCAHSKGDDSRPLQEIEKYRLKDPLVVLEQRLDKDEVLKARTEVMEVLRKAEGNAERSSYIKLELNDEVR